MCNGGPIGALGKPFNWKVTDMIAAKNMPREGKTRPVQCLIVTDESRSLVSAQLRQMLERQGVSPLQACGAQEALQHCWRNAPQVIFLPQTMKGEDAAIVLRRIRNMPRTAGAIVLVYAERLDSQALGRMIWEGAADGIAQPFNSEILAAKLRLAGLQTDALARMGG